jgi:MinD superfamily P-loop ATPase
VNELVVISGKGGTGKTSIVASIAALAGTVVIADCDVDAADLHLLLGPQVERTIPFSGGKSAEIEFDRCSGCGKCWVLCRFDAIERIGAAKPVFSIDASACEGCGVCAHFCPEEAISMQDVDNGEWFISGTRHGPLVHARLRAGAENSGKLVTLVRSEANKIAREKGTDLVLIDGSPGIGCPVIASITGADLVLVVTEPTVSGVHDLKRVTALTRHFGIETAVVVNKYDINEAMTRSIEEAARTDGLSICGRVRYDRRVTEAQIEGASIVETDGGAVREDIEHLWDSIRTHLEQRGS